MQFAELRREHSAQPSVMQGAYASPMVISSSRHLRRQSNLQTLIQENGGASALALLIDTPKSHISALVAGKRGIGDELAAKLERKCGKSQGWMDEAHEPSVAALAEAASRPVQLSGGRLALLLGEAYAALPARTRSHVAHLAGEMIENGPDESQASAIDALATVEVSLPAEKSAGRQEEHPLMGEFVDLDQQVLDTVRHLARLSHTMTSPQRRAMVAALQGTKETSWDSTHETSSGRTISPPMEEPGSQPIYRSPGGSIQTTRKTK